MREERDGVKNIFELLRENSDNYLVWYVHFYSGRFIRIEVTKNRDYSKGDFKLFEGLVLRTY